MSDWGTECNVTSWVLVGGGGQRLGANTQLVTLCGGDVGWPLGQGRPRCFVFFVSWPSAVAAPASVPFTVPVPVRVPAPVAVAAPGVLPLRFGPAVAAYRISRV